MLSALLKRLRNGRTVADVAKELGVSEASVYFWESGKIRPPPERIAQLADAFGLSSVEREELARVYVFGEAASPGAVA